MNFDAINTPQKLGSALGLWLGWSAITMFDFSVNIWYAITGYIQNIKTSGGN